MKLKVSVVIPTIGRNTLENSINSIIRQSYINMEIIIVDDSDNQNIVVSGHTFLRTGGSKGPGYARNLGVEFASGNFIAFLDDDDVWKKDKILLQILEMQGKNLDVLLSAAEVNGEVRPLPESILQMGRDPLELLYLKPHILKSRAYLPTASYIVKTKVFEIIKFSEDLIDRENLLFLSECFSSGLQLSQNPTALIEVNYKKTKSLSRMSLESEKKWHQFLLSKNKIYARNFAIESARNFTRRRDFNSAGQMLKLIWTGG